MTLNAIIANFQTFKIVDLLDIIIIAFLIYQLLGIINRTRAGQLAKGALLVMVVYLVANTLNMRTVTWLLNSLLQVGLLTLVVLFQPEIRRALERMGQTDQWASKLFNVKGRYNDPSLKGAWRSAIIAICDAAERFSETKTGALIVLERHTNLSEIVRTGTPVNSAVNLEVLGTIFYEGTPLHDGAAIIENGRIKAAGCVLPLSNNLDLGKDMGTRHRACLGIAENSDAIAIVVSEETGIISMAKNGVLIRHFDRQSLYTRLIDEMIPKESTVEKNTADSWVEQAKKLWNWISQKGEDEHPSAYAKDSEARFHGFGLGRKYLDGRELIAYRGQRRSTPRQPLRSGNLFAVLSRNGDGEAVLAIGLHADDRQALARIMCCVKRYRPLFLAIINDYIRTYRF